MNKYCNKFFGGYNEKLSTSQFLQVSVMLLGLFFGAGNLIFPPLLGNQAGSFTFISLLAFCVTAVIFPVMGAIVVGKTEGLTNLSNRVSPLFSVVFTTAFINRTWTWNTKSGICSI